ncbi:MAG: FAD-binding protein [Gammaproteobacteria bacterium]|nr:FAD-binding protein [Gammaproteobacteria bacterium]MDH4254829.1 FAD-binding protein [Gammaproteobacteria bacterium]MDH5310098.1 FAD-binding protein [Gammaproteobacteria bacterium]
MNRRKFVSSGIAAAVAAALANQRLYAALLAASDTVEAEVNAISGEGAEVILQRAAVQELADSLRGNLLLPGHAAYEEARRILNPSIDKHPALIVQPKGVADVKNAVDFARDSNLLVAVKCGGHSPSGKSTCDGGMMIDLSLLRSVRVDPDRRIAQVSGGSLLGDMDHDTMAFGLVTTAGTVSHTGVGGLTLGGGFGRLARRFGLALDNVRGVELITADGRFVRASPDENPDLYWGVRGGGGNFGIATSFEFQLHPMDRQVIGGDIMFPISEAPQLLRFYAEYAAGAPDELYLDGGLVSIPGQFSGVWFHVCYSGDKALADKFIDPIRKAGTPVVDTVGPVDYTAIQKSADVSDPRARGSWMKSGFASEISEGMIDAIIDGWEEHPERGMFVVWQHAGGAIGRVPDDATAFAHRHVRHDTLFLMDWAMGVDPAPHVKWLRDYFATVEPYTYGFYTNDVMDESQAKVNRNYLGHYDRLVELKNKYDPTNLFRLNANIVPTAGSA